MLRDAAWLVTAGAANLAGGFWLDRRVLEVGRGYVVSVERAPPADAAVVLGCRVGDDGRPMPMLEDRLQAALDLMKSGRVGKIVLSGGSGEVDAMESWMLEHDVPPRQLIPDREGYRTQATIDRAAGLAESRNLLFSTQEFHAPRTAYLARRAGLDAHVVVADRRSYAHMSRNEARESLARMRAVLDGTLTRRRAP